ncbi:phosphogluconate dehydrogenase NADP decarboxylating [Tubulinosema ratisbonensis]|uniref:6-phosphogluconate dehydrogenase, decarboxylating n=1 Tax=Tubulinosema ratisbonensis TaxID=291195 RepID=A0A437AMU3_9MICR|nr:phosphogluconate dehydrogenase NADP decarboxylating [Tubulinosema ratisbonensis]
MDVGVIGLGVMGENLILNIEEKGFNVSIYNRTTTKTDNLIEKHKNLNLLGCKDLKSFVDSLSSPRKIILLIKSGNPVDAMIDKLVPYVNKEDVIIDAGNSFYEDTERRSLKYENIFSFLGVGISGGELGARHGPSIMVGGCKKGWEIIKPIFEKIAAKADDISCCAYFGNTSSGHFVKMVHNGIEYCEMQLLCEVYFLFKKSKLNTQKITKILKKWLKTEELESYLLEITTKILDRDDELINKVLDAASQKGTGMQCVSTALNFGSINTMMSDSVFARIISSKKTLRTVLFEKYGNKIDENIVIEENCVKNAFTLAKAVAYVQGYVFMLEVSKIKNWNINIKEVSQIWKNGCILRGGFLQTMIKMETDGILLKNDTFKQIYENGFEDLKYVLKCAIDKNLPMPCFSSALNYLNGMIIKDGSGNLIQALRDCFGSHTVQLEGSDEFVHIDWLNW